MKLSKNEKENLYFYSNLSPSLMENCLPSQFRSTLLAKTLAPFTSCVLSSGKGQVSIWKCSSFLHEKEVGKRNHMYSQHHLS